MRYHYSTALSDEHGRLLLLRDGDSWRLPTLSQEEFHPWQDVHREHAALRDKLGVCTIATLKLVAVEWDESAGFAIYLYARVVLDQSWEVPDGAGWFTPEEAMALPLGQPDPLGVLQTWQTWRSSKQDYTPLPWSGAGWYSDAWEWADAALARKGYHRSGPFHQLTSRPRGTVLRAETSGGPVFLKGVSDVFGYEPALAYWLSQEYPTSTARVIDVEAERGLYLANIAGQIQLADVADRAVWLASVDTLSRLQVSAAGRSAELEVQDVPVADVTSYVTQLRGLLDEGLQLDGEYVARLRSCVQDVEQWSDTLTDDGIPSTLEHGDLSPWQILVHDGDTRILDWSDASISHPFFSMVGFLDMVQSLRGSGAPQVTQTLTTAFDEAMVDQYLSPWTQFASLDQLRSSFESATRLYHLHSALKFSRILRFPSDPQWDFQGGVESHLVRMIDDGN